MANRNTKFGPRDMLAAQKGPKHNEWESTTDVLNFLPGNSLNMQFKTRDTPKQSTKSGKRTPKSRKNKTSRSARKKSQSEPRKKKPMNFLPVDAENQTPAMLNSPPQNRVVQPPNSAAKEAYIASPYAAFTDSGVGSPYGFASPKRKLSLEDSFDIRPASPRSVSKLLKEQKKGLRRSGSFIVIQPQSPIKIDVAAIVATDAAAKALKIAGGQGTPKKTPKQAPGSPVKVLNPLFSKNVKKSNFQNEKIKGNKRKRRSQTISRKSAAKMQLELNSLEQRMKAINAVQLPALPPSPTKECMSDKSSRKERRLEKKNSKSGTPSPKRKLDLSDMSEPMSANRRRVRRESPRKNHLSKLQGLRDRGSSDQLIRSASNKRVAACYEMQETEARYIQRLRALLDVKNVLMSSKGADDLVSAEESKLLFGNIESILVLSERLLAGMRAVISAQDFESSSHGIGNVLSDHLPFMAIYGDYLINYKRAGTVFQQLRSKKRFVQLLSKMSSSSIPGGASAQDVQNWLAEPYQRIMRYPVLLDEIIRHTDADHPGREELEDVLKRFRELLDTINDKVRDNEGRTVYMQVKRAFHELDAETLGEQEGNDRTRKLVFDSGFRTLPESELKYVGLPAEGSVDLLMKGLDALSNTMFDPTSSVESLDMDNTFMFLTGKDIAGTLLRPGLLPTRSEEQDDGCNLSQSDENDNSMLDDDEEMLEEDDDGTRFGFLCNDVLVLAFRDQDSGKLCLDSLVPLHLMWIVDDEKYPDNLIIAWPGGMRRLAVDQSFGCPATQKIHRGNITVLDWQGKIERAVDARLEADANCKSTRDNCRLWIESDGGITIEKPIIGSVEAPTEADAEASINASLQLAKYAEVSKQVKRKGSIRSKRLKSL